MSKRKTFEVEAFKKFANDQLARTDEHANNSAFRSAICVAVEKVLHDANQYKGFTNLYWSEGGCSQWEKNGKTEEWDAKKDYIYGTANSKYKGDQYARRYY